MRPATKLLYLARLEFFLKRACTRLPVGGLAIDHKCAEEFAAQGFGGVACPADAKRRYRAARRGIGNSQLPASSFLRVLQEFFCINEREFYLMCDAGPKESDVVVIADDDEVSDPRLQLAQSVQPTTTLLSRLASMPKPELVLVAAHQEECLNLVRKRVREQNQTIRRLRAKLNNVIRQQEASAIAHADSDKFQIVKSARKVPFRSFIAMGLRRNLSNIAAKDFGLVAMCDISKTSVLRGEVVTAAGIIATSRVFHASLRAFLGEPRPALPLSWQDVDVVMEFRLVGYSFRGDATNSGIWNGCKLQNLEVSTSWLSNPCAVLESGDADEIFSRAFSSISRVADCQIVNDNTAAGCLGMVTKQMEGLGVPTWQDTELLPPPPANFDLKRHGLLDAYVYCIVSDAGPDQAAARRLISVELSEVPHAFFFDSNCLQHQCHLVVKHGLQIGQGIMKHLFDDVPWNFFTALTKIGHSWRAKWHKAYKLWVRRFGAVSASEKLHHVMPKCVGGRWGSIFASEEFVLNCGMEKVRTVMREALAPDAKAKLRVAGPGAADALQEVHLEEMAAYSAKLSRWNRDSLTAIDDDRFWRLLAIYGRVHEVGEHFKRYMEKVSAKSRAIVDLVTKKSAIFMREYDHLFSDEWCVAFLAVVPADDHHIWMQVSATMWFHHAGAFHRRVLRQCDRWVGRLKCV